MTAKPLLYLHGFASSPGSRKGRAFEDHFSARGYAVERLDLRVPDRDRLRVSAMIEVVVAAAQRHRELVLVGSSLGGLVAAHAAAQLTGVRALVLMAPAFRFARRWGERLGAAALRRWQAGEPLTTPDHAGGPPLQVDHGFYRDACAIDAGWPALAAPTLVFHGVGDEVVPPEGSRELLAAAPEGCDIRLVELDDGHSLVESVPRILADTEAFLDRAWKEPT